MELELGRGAYISIKTCAQGVSLYSDDGPDCDDCTIQILSRKQVIELIAMLLVNTCPAPTSEEIDDAVVRLIFNNLPPGHILGTMTEADFMEDHGDNL